MEQSAGPSQAIFKEYDIRGIYGQEFDDVFAREMANKVIGHMGARTVLVGRDGRQSSESLQRLVIVGAQQTGARVIDIGLATTPLFYFSTLAAGADLGIMVTASHNPPEYNGLKMIRKDGTLVGGHELQRIWNEEYTAGGPEAAQGSVEATSFAEQYRQAVMQVVGPEPIGGTVSVNAPPMLRPSLDALFAQYQITADPGAAIHAHFDPDADRIRLHEHGVEIGADYLFALLATQLGCRTVVHDFRFSFGVRQALAQAGMKAIVSRVGRVHLAAAMRQNDADFGAETSGHFYFKAFNYLEAPEVVLLIALRAVARGNTSLLALTQPYRTYAKSEEMVFGAAQEWSVVRAAILEQFSDGQVHEDDGITVIYTDPADNQMLWWFNVRPSNTEPVLRFVAEARTKEFLDQKVAQLRSLLGA